MDIATHSARRCVRRGSLLVAAPIVTALLVSGCGAGDTPGAASAGDTGVSTDSAAMSNTGKASSARGLADAVTPAAPEEVQRRAVISTGHIELTSSDVAATRTRLDDVLAKDGGRVADENTTTDDRGTVTRSHLVLRVPSGRFDDAMRSLAGIASLRSSSRKAEDVTTQVIDLGARIAAERAGVRRLRRLVSTTADLRALLDVERALTARQGELESLRQQRTYLADQSSEATITVDVSRRTTPAPVAVTAGGFVGGLGHGWHGLVAVITGFLLGLGVLLPFAVAVGVLGFPAWLVVRRTRRLRERGAPAES
jgi:hypothetical protein